MAWHAGEISRAWDSINRAVREALKPLHIQTLRFLAHRASDGFIRQAAFDVLAWRENPDLPSWGWWPQQKEHLRPAPF
jgi:hypothetical protein